MPHFFGKSNAPSFFQSVEKDVISYTVLNANLNPKKGLDVFGGRCRRARERGRTRVLTRKRLENTMEMISIRKSEEGGRGDGNIFQTIFSK